MGEAYDAECKHCSMRFRVHVGGGMAFHLLHCDQCGAEKSVTFDALQRHYDAFVVWGDEFNPTIEAFAGACACGGSFRMEAPPRCTRCHSTDLKRENGPGSCIECYD